MRCEKQVRQNLRYSNCDGFLFSLMVGSGETFLPAFVLAMGMGEVTTGLVSALPYLAGASLQLLAPYLLPWVGSYRRWISGLAALQGLCFLPLIGFAVTGRMSLISLFVVVTFYWGFGMGTGPAWNTWMSRLVPLGMRARYFALRSRIAQFGVLLGLVGGGFLLEAAKVRERELEAFAVLFSVAGIFRLGSSWFLARQSEPRELVSQQRHIRPTEMWQKLRSGHDGQLLIFLLVFQITVHFSAPFFNPFMLKHLSLSYTGYMWLVATSFITKVAVFPLVGRWCQSFGSLRLMQIGAIGIAFLPLLWVVSSDYRYLILTQVLSGTLWAFFELGTLVAFFDTIRDDERTSFLAIYNFANAIALFAGTIAGAQTLSWLGPETSSYYTLFTISTLGRLGSFFLLGRVVVAIHAPERLIMRTVGVRPSQGAMMVPVLPPLEERPDQVEPEVVPIRKSDAG